LDLFELKNLPGMENEFNKNNERFFSEPVSFNKKTNLLKISKKDLNS